MLRHHSVPGSMPWPFPPARLFNRPGRAESATYPLCPSAPSPTGSGSIDPVPSCVKHSMSKANVVLSSCSGFLPPWWWPCRPPSCSSSRWVSLLQPGSDHRTHPSRTSILARLAEFIPEGLRFTPYSRHTSEVAFYFLFLNFIQSSASVSLAAISLGQLGKPGAAFVGSLRPGSCPWTWPKGLPSPCCGLQVPARYPPPEGGTEGLGLVFGGHRRTPLSGRETVEARVALVPALDPSCWEL